ncbi:2643_t:CDS:2 [Entrophospora sp. SA101]|nr:2643_t:CDS:2 [Entrophospora sp. SA101]CAJ0896390.1 9717_t:CDS:2 [Entrophospora sp. SA101]
MISISVCTCIIVLYLNIYGECKASDWGDMEAYLWKGRLRIISKGEKCFIRLEDGGTGELFAQSPYNPDKNSVESVRDSSRYFVLRVEDDDGRHAFIGMGFRERTEAFDFQVALQDHIKHVKIEKESAEKSKQINLEPKKNFSLKEGETISITIAVNVSGNNGASFGYGDFGDFVDSSTK